MIRLKTLMILQAIGLAVAGLGTLFFPRQYMGAFGVNLESNALTLAHIYGATALMIAVVVWLAKDAAASDGRRAILIGCLVGNVLAALVALFDILGGLLPAVAWVNFVIFILFAVGFAYFLFMKPTSA